MSVKNSMQGWVQVFDQFTASKGTEKGKRVFVTADKKAMYDFIESHHTGDYHLTALAREIMNLSSDPFPPHSRAVDTKEPNKRSLELDGGRIEYFLYHGDVLIHDLDYGNSFRNRRGTSDRSGLYRASWDGGLRSWHTVITNRLSTSTKIGDAHCAALSGSQFIDPAIAAKALNIHIQKAFKVREPEIEKSGKHFSLYFLRKGEHKSESRSREVASLIELAAKENAAVHWLAQGEGSEVMLGALRELKKHPIHENVRKNIRRQKLFFSNHTASIRDLIQLRDEIGFSKEGKGYNSSPLDIRAGGLIKNNLIAEITLAGERAAEDARSRNNNGFLAKQSAHVNTALNNPLIATGAGASGIAAAVWGAGEAIAVLGTEGAAIGGAAALVVMNSAFKLLKKGPSMADAIETLLALLDGKGRAVWFDDNKEFAADVYRPRTKEVV